MALSKIDDKLLENEKRYHTCQSDVPDKKASEMKDFMDYIPRNVIIPKINEIIGETSNKANKEDVYSKAETDELLGAKPDADNVYTKEEADIILSKKASINNVYEKDEAERTFATALKGNAYGKSFVVNDAIAKNHAIDLKLSSKNLITFGYTSKTIDGVNFNVASDGSITLNGTATEANTVRYALNTLTLFEAGTYYMSGCPAGGSTNKYYLTVVNDNGTNYTLFKTETGNGFLLTLKEPEFLKFYIRVAPGVTVENVVFKPMFEKSNTKTEYTKHVTDFSEYLTFVDFYQDGVMQNGYCCTSDRFGNVDNIATESSEFKVEVNGDDVVVNVEYIKDLNKTIDKILKAIS